MIDVILIVKNKNKNEILLFFKSLFFKSRNIDDSIIRFSEKLIFKRGKINSISHFHVSRINQFQLHSKNFQKILKFLFPRKRNLKKTKKFYCISFSYFFIKNRSMPDCIYYSAKSCVFWIFFMRSKIKFSSCSHINR